MILYEKLDLTELHNESGMGSESSLAEGGFTWETIQPMQL
jgi:hypothetical protein